MCKLIGAAQTIYVQKVITEAFFFFYIDLCVRVCVTLWKMNGVLTVVIVDIQILVNAAVIDAPMWIKSSCIYLKRHLSGSMLIPHYTKGLRFLRTVRGA